MTMEKIKMAKSRMLLHKRRMQQRRHYLVKRLRHKFKINSNTRTIELQVVSVEDIEPPERYYVRQLLKTGYQSQLTLF